VCLQHTVAKEAKAALQTDTLEAVARGYFNGEEIVACDQAGITLTMPTADVGCQV
jgi:hypothetical protein